MLQFFEKGFRFTENVFKVKVLKTFKISPDCQLKTLRSLKRKVILKSLGILLGMNKMYKLVIDEMYEIGRFIAKFEYEYMNNCVVSIVRA